jgi:hypothetical protein
MNILARIPVRLVHALAALVVLAAASPVTAQQPGGVVEGMARNANDGTPLPFLLIHLVPSAPQPGVAAQRVLTDASGRYRAEGVPAGEYRLQVEQIGYERSVSPPVRVEAGATLQQDVRGAMVPIQLAGLTVRAGGGCLTGARLGEEPELATLWNEAKKGVEIRRAFDLQYRYTEILRQEGQMRWRFKGPSPIVRADTATNEPDSVLVRERRRMAAHRARGYGTQSGSFILALPAELDMMSDEFLQTHCLETGIDRGEGTLALRFRPVQSQRNQIALRAAIWLDDSTYQIRRLEFEHFQNGRSIANTHVDYRDVTVGGSRLRLPSSGRVEGRPSGRLGLLLTGVAATLTYSYRGFEQVGSR